MYDYERQLRRAEAVKKMYPPGTRIMLLKMNDPYAPIEPVFSDASDLYDNGISCDPKGIALRIIGRAGWILFVNPLCPSLPTKRADHRVTALPQKKRYEASEKNGNVR